MEIDIIRNNYCIGCGICTIHKGVNVKFNDLGMYQVNYEHLNELQSNDLLKICPFSSYSSVEDDFASFLFDKSCKIDTTLGAYLKNFSGYTTNETNRLKSSSGGIITWFLIKLLKQKIISHAVFVGNSSSNNALFEYKVSSNEAEIKEGASSKYYPVELSNVLSKIKENDGKYAIIALPCFTKGIRLLQLHYPIFKERIKYIIAPVCGHLKSKHYAEFLAWQKGFRPTSLVGINFRKKLCDLPASNYGTEFKIREENNTYTYTIRNNTFRLGTNWGHGMFKYPACDYCDDIFGELADASVGDAWLKEFLNDYRGTSIITVRNINLLGLLHDGICQNELTINEIDADRVILSQSGGIKNKKEDLSYRLYLKQYKNEWHPPKRISASKKTISLKRRIIIRYRIRISFLSHKLYLIAKERKEIRIFFSRLAPSIFKYQFLYSNPLYMLIRLFKRYFL